MSGTPVPNNAGAIPDAIGGLSRLTSLRLDHNSLSGRLPGSLTRLTSLTNLDLAWNKLSGTIPMKIGTMTTLRSLNLGMNQARWQMSLTMIKEGIHRIFSGQNQRGKTLNQIHHLLTVPHKLKFDCVDIDPLFEASTVVRSSRPNCLEISC